MVTVRESKFIKFEEGISIELMYIDVGSASELPQADFLDGKLLYQGSIAHDISTGDFYCIDSEGTWYAQDGSGAYEPEEAQNAPQNLNLSPLGFDNVSQPDMITPVTEPVSILNVDVSDNNVGEITEDEETGETTEEVLGNELNALSDEPEETDNEESE